MQLQNIPLNKFIFLDIQTVAQHPNIAAASPATQLYWHQKFTDATIDYAQQAALVPEFAKIICVSVAGLVADNSAENAFKLKIKTLANSDEHTLLLQLSQLLVQYKPIDKRILIGHNIKEFDLPVLCKRLIINGLPLPNILDISGLKPWDMPVFDTMQWWQFGGFKGGVSLRLLAHALSIDGGAEMQQYVVNNAELQQNYHIDPVNIVKAFIKRCQQNIILMAQIAMKLQNHGQLSTENIEIL